MASTTTAACLNALPSPLLELIALHLPLWDRWAGSDCKRRLSPPIGGLQPAAGCLGRGGTGSGVAHLPPNPAASAARRVRLLTLNKAFLALASGSTSLWRDLSFTLQAPKDVERMARWLASKRQRLGALRIRVAAGEHEGLQGLIERHHLSCCWAPSAQPPSTRWSSLARALWTLAGGWHCCQSCAHWKSRRKRCWCSRASHPSPASLSFSSGALGAGSNSHPAACP